MQPFLSTGKVIHSHRYNSDFLIIKRKAAKKGWFPIFKSNLIFDVWGLFIPSPCLPFFPSDKMQEVIYRTRDLPKTDIEKKYGKIRPLWNFKIKYENSNLFLTISVSPFLCTWVLIQSNEAPTDFTEFWIKSLGDIWASDLMIKDWKAHSFPLMQLASILHWRYATIFPSE